MYVQHVGEPSFLYPAPLYKSLAPVYSTGMEVHFNTFAKPLGCRVYLQAKRYTGVADLADSLALPIRQLHWSIQDAACSFIEAGLCIIANITPVTLDTGHSHSNHLLGIESTPGGPGSNTGKVLPCSPMPANRRC